MPERSEQLGYVDEVPEGWAARPLESVLAHVMDYRGRTPKKIGMQWGGGEIPALSAKNVCMGGIDLSRETYFGSEKLYARWMTNGDTEQGDILLTLEAPLGNVAWIPDDRRYILSQRVVLLRPDSQSLDKTFLRHQLMSERFQKTLVRESTGTTATGIQRAKLEKIPLLFPILLKEQERIGEIIDTLDATIRGMEAVVAKLRQVNAGLLHDLLTRGLDENGHLRDPAHHPEQFQDSPIGLIPEAWQCPHIGDIANHIGSGATPRGGSAVYRKEGITFVRSQNVTFDGLLLSDVVFISHAIHAAMSRSEIFPFDVLLNITGASIGRCCFVPAEFGPANVNQHVCAIRLPKPRLDDGIVLAAILASQIGQSQIDRLNAGGNREGLNYTQVRSFFVPWPEPEERTAIAERLEQAKSRLESEESQLSKLYSLKRGLAHDLLTGHVRVKPTTS